MPEENDTTENQETPKVEAPTPAPAPAVASKGDKRIKDTPFVDDEAGQAAKEADDRKRSEDTTVDWSKYPNKVR